MVARRASSWQPPFDGVLDSETLYDELLKAAAGLNSLDGYPTVRKAKKVPVPLARYMAIYRLWTEAVAREGKTA